jgi:hypothetical protein
MLIETISYIDLLALFEPCMPLMQMLSSVFNPFSMRSSQVDDGRYKGDSMALSQYKTASFTKCSTLARVPP